LVSFSRSQALEDIADVQLSPAGWKLPSILGGFKNAWTRVQAVGGQLQAAIQRATKHAKSAFTPYSANDSRGHGDFFQTHVVAAAKVGLGGTLLAKCECVSNAEQNNSHSLYPTVGPRLKGPVILAHLARAAEVRMLTDATAASRKS